MELDAALRHPRRRARARRARARAAAAAARLRRPAVGLLGARDGSRPGRERTLVRGRVNGKARDDHRRLVGHRPLDRAEGRRRGRHAAARRPQRRQARGGAAEIGAAGGTAYVYAADLSDMDSIDAAGRAGARRPPRRRHARQQRRPLDPALDRAQLRPLPRLRAHDPAELLRRGQADHRPAAAHARARLGPHRQRLLDRRADEPAALLGLRRLQGGARRVHARRGLRGDRRRRHVHDDPHAARAHADDRADEDVRRLPDDHARRRPPT